MSSSSANDDERIFKTRERRDEFWTAFNALVDSFPEVINFDYALAGDMDEEGLLYNPDSPKYLQGCVIIITARNLDNWESLCVLDPREQSSYMTTGMISSARDLQS